MKSISRICISLIFFTSLFSYADESASARMTAEIMGDIAFHQTSPDAHARDLVRHKIDSLRRTISVSDSHNNGKLAQLINVMSHAGLRSTESTLLSSEDLTRIIASYEEYFSYTLHKEKPDPVFRMLDLRFRYLARTSLANSGIAKEPALRYSVESSYGETDKLVTAELGKAGREDRKRNWNYLGSLIMDYRTRPAPYIVNSMMMRMCNEEGLI